MVSLRSALTTSFTPRFTCLCLEAASLDRAGDGCDESRGETMRDCLVRNRRRAAFVRVVVTASGCVLEGGT